MFLVCFNQLGHDPITFPARAQSLIRFQHSFSMLPTNAFLLLFPKWYLIHNSHDSIICINPLFPNQTPSTKKKH